MSDTAPAISTPAPATTAAPAVSPAQNATAPASDAKVPLVVPTGEKAPADAKTAPVVEVAESVSKHFAEIERRKAALKADQEKTAAERKAMEPELAAFREWKAARESKDPLKVLKHSGLTQSQIAEALLADDAEAKPDPVAEVRAELDAMKKAAAEAKAKADAELRAETDRKNIAHAMNQVRETLKAPEFKLTAKHGDEGANLVYDVMTDVFVRTQKVIPFAQACAEVEAHYRKIADLAKEDPKAAAELEAAPKAPQTAKDKATTVTITNKTNADTPPGDQQTDDKTKRARAIAVLDERLKAKAARLSSGA